MDHVTLTKAREYLERLCAVKPNRRTGSAGNRQATDFFAGMLREWGYAVDTTSFECLDYVRNGVELSQGRETFEVQISPYSPGCEVQAELVVVSTVEELEAADCAGKILLMHGEICAEQLMPKNFVFYNPEHHQQLIALLEQRQPGAIITATARNPELVGALYPFPLFVDGDFDIPSVYCTEILGERLAALEGQLFRLKIDARRIPARACNVIGRLNPGTSQKIVLTAHIDAYEDTPGASDNASGCVVLLLVAEMLADFQGACGVEIAVLNGEDHYSAGGQMDYLRRYGGELGQIRLVINIDDVGYIEGRNAYSFYECPAPLEQQVQAILTGFPGLIPGEAWYAGDHMIFVQNGVPALAFTAEYMPELMQRVTHTQADTPELVDPGRLVEVARGVEAVVRGQDHTRYTWNVKR